MLGYWGSFSGYFFEKPVTANVHDSQNGEFYFRTVFPCVAMGTLTTRFYSDLVQRYKLVFLTKLQIFVKIDRETTSQ